MELLILEDDPEAFRARVEPTLLAQEAENNLLFGILRGIESRRYAEALLVALERDGEVAAVAIRTPPWPLALSRASEAAAARLAELLSVRGVDLPGVNGPSREAEAFAAAWSAITGTSSRRVMSQRIYRLEHLRAPTPAPGRLRRADEGDRALLVRWFRGFHSDAMPADDPVPDDETVTARLNDGDGGLFLWEHGGASRTMVGAGGRTPNGIRIGPVYTPPEDRRWGYASAATAALSERLLAGGRRFCFLYTDLGNPTSNAIYQRLGYEPVCDAARIRFEAPHG